MKLFVPFHTLSRLRLSRLVHFSRQLLLSSSCIALLTGLVLILQPTIRQDTASLLYILVVIFSATTFGLWLSLVTSILAFLAFNFFIIYPYQSFGVTSIEDAVRLIIFLGVSILASHLAGRARNQAIATAQHAAELSALYTLSQTISAAVDLDHILPTIAQTTLELLPIMECRIFLNNVDGQCIEYAHAGIAPHDGRKEHVDLHIKGRSVGVLWVIQGHNQERLTSSERKLLLTIALQTGLVLERSRLADEAGHARSLAETNRLTSTLLSSVSHDLRTPLAVIKGAVTNLQDDTVNWTLSTQHELLTSIEKETDRLNRLVSDLLEMSRIEAGALHQTRNQHDLSELISYVAEHVQSQLINHRIELDVQTDLPPTQISYTQIDHVLTNLLENAGRYTPDNTVITIRAYTANKSIYIEVLDQGPGIPPAMQKRIFEKFVRSTAPERCAKGTGLGLAICKGLVEAHNGRIWVENRAEGGARFIFTLPLTHTHSLLRATNTSTAQEVSL